MTGARHLTCVRGFATPGLILTQLLLFAGMASASILDPGSFASLGVFNPGSNVTINTDTLAMTGGATFTGVNSGGIAVFDFSSINLTGALTLSVTGSRPLALLTTGNATLSGTLTIAASATGGPGVGGTASDSTGSGGGGGFGGVGGAGAVFISGAGPGGGTYGNLFTTLTAGSAGGGGGGGGAGGLGGNALEIVSLGSLTIAGTLTANGGAGTADSAHFTGGGGGSGGGILLSGSSVAVTGVVSARGAAGITPGSSISSGTGGGGGGRIAISTPGYVVSGGLLAVDGGLGGPGAGFTTPKNGVAGQIGTVDWAGGIIVPTGQALQLTGGRNTVSGFISVQSTSGGGGVLQLQNSYANTAEIDLGGSNAHIQGTAWTNTGQVRGGGVIDSAVTNGPGGQMIVSAGERLVLGAAGSSNGGTVNVVGGEFETKLPFTNSTAGFMTGRDATFRFDQGLTNNGSIGITFGTTDVFGAINNTATGHITVSGGANATFFNDVVNGGAITVSASGGTKSTAVFFGALSGNGIQGGGTVFIEGDLSPGFSPAAVSFGGDLILGNISTLDIQFGGLTPGTQFDTISVAGLLGLDGLLNISWINGFHGVAGNTWDFLDWGQLSGQFASIALPQLDPGLHWNTSSLYADGSVSVDADAPEPAAIFLVAAGLALLCFRRRLLSRSLR